MEIFLSFIYLFFRFYFILERWYGEGGGRGVQDWEHVYTRGGFMLMCGDIFKGHQNQLEGLTLAKCGKF